jgi:hypothetical protein
MSSSNFFHVTTAKGLKSILKDGFIEPKIGKRSKALKEKKPFVYVFKGKAAMEDGFNWLEEHFADEEEMFAIELHESAPFVQNEDAQYEWRSELKVELDWVVEIRSLDTEKAVDFEPIVKKIAQDMRL